jgi:hypothetical protein
MYFLARLAVVFALQQSPTLVPFVRQRSRPEVIVSDARNEAIRWGTPAARHERTSKLQRPQQTSAS